METLTKSLKIEPSSKNRALTYFHRFYVYQSLADFDELDMVACCLFVALKVDDKVIKMETLLKFAYGIKNHMLRRKVPKLEMESQTYFELKESLQMNERILLQTLGFDLDMTMPGALFLNFVSRDRNEPAHRIIPDGSHKELAKLAWEWHNLSYGANFCVRYTPEFSAAAFLFASAHHLRLRMNTTAAGLPWWTALCPAAAEDQLHVFVCEFYDYCLHCREPRDDEVTRLVHSCPRHTVPLAPPTGAGAAAAAAAASPAAPSPSAPSPATTAAATAVSAAASAAAGATADPHDSTNGNGNGVGPPSTLPPAAAAAAAASVEPSHMALPPPPPLDALPSAEMVAAALLGEF